MAHDRIPQSAIESAIHAENQAAAKEPPGKGIIESLYDIFREAVSSIRHEMEVVFWGRDTLPRQNETYHHGKVEVGDRQMTYDEIAAQRAEMMPPPTEQTPEQQAPGIDR